MPWTDAELSEAECDFLRVLKPVLDSREDAAGLRFNAIPSGEILSFLRAKGYETHQIHEIARNLYDRGFVTRDKYGFFAPTQKGEEVVRGIPDAVLVAAGDALLVAGDEPVATHASPMPESCEQFSPACSALVATHAMLCRGCGQRLAEDARYCHRCGIRVMAARQDSGGRDPFFADADAETFIDPAAGAGHATPVPDDYDVWHGRFSVKAMYGVLTLSFACTVAACLNALGLAVRASLREALLMLAVVPAVWLLVIVRLLRKKMRARYRLTPRRLVAQFGWLGRNRRELALSDVSNVLVCQNPIERFLGVGSLEVCARSGSQHNLRLVGIDDPTGVADRIWSRAQNPTGVADRILSRAQSPQQSERISAGG